MKKSILLYILFVIVLGCSSDDDTVEDGPQELMLSQEELLIGSWRLLEFSYNSFPSDPTSTNVVEVIAAGSEISQNSVITFREDNTYTQSFSFVANTTFFETNNTSNDFDIDFTLFFPDGVYEFTGSGQLVLNPQNGSTPGETTIIQLDTETLVYELLENTKVIYLNEEIDVIATSTYTLERIN